MFVSVRGPQLAAPAHGKVGAITPARIRLPLLLPTLAGCSNGTSEQESPRLRPDTSRTRCRHCILPARRVRLTDEADRATASCSEYAIHPMRGTTPVTGRYTRSEEVQCPRIGCSAQRNKHFRGPAITPIISQRAHHSPQALHPMRGTTPVTGRYTRSEEVQCPRIGCSAQRNKHFRGPAITPIISQRAHHSPQALHPLRGAAPFTSRYTRSEEVQCPRIGCSATFNKHFRGRALPT